MILVAVAMFAVVKDTGGLLLGNVVSQPLVTDTCWPGDRTAAIINKSDTQTLASEFQYSFPFIFN